MNLNNPSGSAFSRLEQERNQWLTERNNGTQMQSFVAENKINPAFLAAHSQQILNGERSFFNNRTKKFVTVEHKKR